MTESIGIRVEFGGGTELLFDNKKSIDLVLNGSGWNISKLITHLSQNYIKERVELFSSGDKIRPGILILVNEVDYEILGGDSYVVKDKDLVLFISTLHGG